jgi:Xaa-Pro aminopeptidase
VLVSDPVDVTYMSGFSATSAMLLISGTRHYLITDFRYASEAARFCRAHRQWKFVETGDDGFAAVARLLKKAGTVCVQSDSLTVDQFDRLRRACRPASLKKCGDEISRISSVKNTMEIRGLRRAARIGDRALRIFLRRLRIGMTETEGAEMLGDICRKLGSEGPSFPFIILFGPHTAFPHGRPSGVKLRRGNWILCDFGCTVDGMCSDMTRTMVMGRADAKQKEVYAVVHAAQRSVRVSIRPGMRSCDADSCARGIISKAGFGSCFGHATGHGVGRRVHEKPRLSSRDRSILRMNMVVTVEPGIYIPGHGGVRIEDMVVLGPDGAECLTAFPRRLMEIGI